MRLLQQSRDNQGFRTQVMQAITILENCRAFQVLLEICAERGILQPSNTPMEHSALNGAWMAGYHQALKDMQDLAVTQPEGKKPNPQYGMVLDLHKKGDLSDAELKQYRQQHGIDDTK